MNITIQHQNTTILLTDDTTLQLPTTNNLAWDDFNNINSDYLTFFNPDINIIWQSFQQHFIPITAAGGIVVNANSEHLWIYRRGKWDLPKGKKEYNETAEECAIREITEETGVDNLQIIKHLHTTYHTYDTYGSWMLKETVWFLLYCNSKNKLQPQVEEDIEKVVWHTAKQEKEILLNTYENIKEVIQKI